MTLSRENSYLLTYLIGLLILTIILWGINLSYSTLNYIILGFCYNFTIKAPTLREKVLLRKYKFSLLKLIFKFDDFLGSFTNRYSLQIFLRSLPPIILSFVSFLISQNGWFVLTLVGSAYFELIYFLKNKMDQRKLDSVE